MSHRRNVAIFIFPEVEVLDFAGPYEVFATSRDKSDGQTHLFHVYNVAEKPGPLVARNGFTVVPNYSFDDMPEADIVLVPGGQGTRPLVDYPPVIEWIQAQHAQTELTLSVCTGSLLLAKAGLLDGLSATTYHTAFDRLATLAPTATPDRAARFVDNGRIITSAGVSAGIDMALYTVARLHGRAQARFTAEYMEYDHWNETKYAAHLPENP